jgi:hypothetical protein
MDPPSTPAPVAMRGKSLDRALRDVDSKRPSLAPSSHASQAPPSIRSAPDPEAAMAEAERLAREAIESPVSDPPPMTMRGDALERVLHGVRSSPPSGIRVTRH